MKLPQLNALSLIKDLYLMNRNFCSQDYDYCIEYLNNLLPFKIHTYTNNFNSWQIPPRWDLKHAYIKNAQGEIIYQVDHPLKIIGLSTSFSGLVSKEKLLNHLHYDSRDPDAIPYHFRQFYRPWKRTWGFSVPKTFYDSLSDDSYTVDILTQESEGNLKVAEHTKKGAYPYTFVFVAHLDHPGMVNDDLAGVAAGVELFQRLSQIETKFTYKLILVPEIIGSEFYLGSTPSTQTNILESCFLEMLGTSTPLALQKSLNENSQIEHILLDKLRSSNKNFKSGPFKSIICNDEYIWESYQIPMCSLSRFPYPEYHTHKDDLSIFDEKSFFESVEILYQSILELEKLTLIKKNFSGTPCLSHPKYDLYVDPGQRAFGTHANIETQKLRLLMDLIPSQPKLFFLNSALKSLNIPPRDALEYLKKWQDKGLIDIY